MHVSVSFFAAVRCTVAILFISLLVNERPNWSLYPPGQPICRDWNNAPENPVKPYQFWCGDGRNCPYHRWGGTQCSLGIDFTPQSSRAGGAAAKIRAEGDGAGNAGLSLWTATGGSAAAATTRMTILPNGNIGIGTTTPQAAFHLMGGFQIGTTQNAFIPTGVIVLWSGAVVSIPTGWALCDGTNGTPDLRDRFLVGAGSSYAVAATGGSATTTLSVANLPAHSHTGTTDGGGSHNHTFGTTPGGGSTIGVAAQGGAGTPNYTNGTSTVSNHTHSFTTNNTGSGTAFTTLPPYYALAFIMKL